MSTHVGDLLLVADDRTRGMLGRALVIWFNQLKHRSPPFTHCGLFAAEIRGSLNIGQGFYVLGIESLGRNKNLPGGARLGEDSLDRFRHALGSTPISHMALDRMLRRIGLSLPLIH